MDEEYTVKMKVLPAKGRKYHRLRLEIELPEELKEWGIVPAYLFGAEASIFLGELLVSIRKPK